MPESRGLGDVYKRQLLLCAIHKCAVSICVCCCPCSNTVGGSSNAHEDHRRPDGVEANITNSARVSAVGASVSERPTTTGREYSAQLAQSRALSDDAKKLFSDLQLGMPSTRFSVLSLLCHLLPPGPGSLSLSCILFHLMYHSQGGKNVGCRIWVKLQHQ